MSFTFLLQRVRISKITHVASTNTHSQVHSAISSNLFAIYGNAEEKELTELVPGILNQLGPDSLQSLRKLAEHYQSLQGAEKKEGEDEDDDEIPNLIEGESFEAKAAEVE